MGSLSGTLVESLSTVTRHKRSSKLLATAVVPLMCAFLTAPIAAHLGRTATVDDKVNPKALLIKQFTDRAKEYVALQKKLEGALPAAKPTTNPADIEARRKALAAAIRAARQT